MKSLTKVSFLVTFLAGGLLVAGSPTAADAREWSDASGHYKFNGELIAFNEKTVILKRTDKNLVSIEFDKLSEADKKYLQSKEAQEATQKGIDAVQTWTMASGLKVSGRVVEYGRRNVRIERKRGAVYVNDKAFVNLPTVYQKMVPKIVNYFEKTMIENETELNEWLAKRKGKPAEYTLEGVMLALDNGDLYGVPFFFFSEDDLKVLKPGWDRWVAAEEDREKKDQHDMELQAQAQAYQQDKMAQKQMMQMQLQLQAYQAGLFSLWEVQLYPGQNFNGQPVMVVVPGRNSDQAAAAAMAKYPGWTVGGVGQVIRM